MAIQILYYNSLLAIFFTLSLTLQPTESDSLGMPSFAFSWLNNNDTFVAGEIATIKVIVLGTYDSGKQRYPFNPNITVNDKMGNSSFISGVASSFDFADTGNWRISFTPIMVGLFNVLITDEHFHVLDSSLHFRVTTGQMYPAAGIVSWKGGEDEFIAGTKAEVLILPKDAFGNNATSASEGLRFFNFTLSASSTNGSNASVLNVTNRGWNQHGYLSIEFIAATSGSLLLHVVVDNQTFQGSPLPFKVYPGELDVSTCIAQWNIGTKSFQLFSMMEAFIHQHDQYGNLVSGFYAFDIEVIEKGTNLSMPVADLQFKDAGQGIQSFSFSLEEPGNFMLMISNKEQNTLISNMPYDFTVYIGYCDGMNSIVNGSGLNNSLAGHVAMFSVFLKDAYLYPAPVELERLQVQIVHEFDSQILLPSIHIREAFNGSLSHGRLNDINHKKIDSAPIVGPKNDSAGDWNQKASAFDVIYVPEKSGRYEICIFCGNIPLNGGHTFRKEVSPGEVNVSLSGVVKFAPKVSKLTKNEIVVQLMDSYHNPVLLQQSKLKLEIASINGSASSTWTFSDNNDGSYTGSYLANDVGTYELCASYDGNHFMPCPFGVNVYSGEYFPKLYNDTVSVWEDESVDFNVLENDYFAGGNASILEHSKPSHGSLLQNGPLFRYTPYKGFYGNDSFFYTIADINGNVASGAVNLSVLCIPPRFVSIPIELQATEDVVSPRFGGFSGFEIIYSDLEEIITVTLSSLSGEPLLSPMSMQFWQPRWNELSISKDIGMDKEITLVGSVDAINFALQSIQYFGKGNFYGADILRISTINKNGKNNLDVPVYVQPINDPPFINVPSFVILDEKHDEAPIFGRQRENFDFIGDPDLLNFPGNWSRFLVVFSLEVSSGLLSTNLPADLISSTELKLKTSYQWQTLQTFVTISKHFVVKAKGIRIRGTINDCNSIMEQLLYYDGEHNAVLTVTVNDMGNYGCYPNCTEMMSMPLLAESTISLIRRRPISPLAAHFLGSAIVVESIVVFSLGILLLYFMCKCAFVLIDEKRRQKAPAIELSKVQSSSKQTPCVDLPENVKRITGGCSIPFLCSSQTSNFRQRSLQRSRGGESDHMVQSSSQSSIDQHKKTPDVMPFLSE
ncbi:Protein GAMETE EXPRESSED 2 [Forsythia ovata]|uniref:Protein GAMETE EXPRESSED 2 n=1 Tax=Forsythia ovata TaxID=205694 RepID=A0ABD1PKQ8_9LAMI